MPIQLGSNVKLFAVFSITAFHLFFHFSANAAIFGWGRAKKSCELALSMNGAEVQIDEILAGKPTLLKILSENVWTKDYAATLATLGED